MRYKSIKLKKIQREQLDILYQSLNIYALTVNMYQDFNRKLIYLDTINILQYKIRKATELHQKVFSLSLSVAEACIIQEVILYTVYKHPYVVMTYENFKDQLQRELLKIEI